MSNINEEDFLDDIIDGINNVKNQFSSAGRIERIPIENPNQFPKQSDLSRVPVVIFSDAVPFPDMPMNLPQQYEENNPKITEAIKTGDPVLLVYADPDKHVKGSSKGLAHSGVLGRIIKLINESHEEYSQLLCFGGPRVEVEKYNTYKGVYTATLHYQDVIMDVNDYSVAGYLDAIRERYDALLELGHAEGATRAADMIGAMTPVNLLNTLAFQLPLNPFLKAGMLDCNKFSSFADLFLHHIDVIYHITKEKAEILERTHAELDRQQREMFLQQQLGIINNELGHGENSDIANFKKRAAEKKWGDETKAHFERELEKLSRYNSSSPDYSVQYSYLDTFLSLPWRQYSAKSYTLDEIEQTLDRDHFGLERVKERILEQMAVASLRSDNKAPILCLVGPPGVGKTSLGRSIAEAMGRDYARVSFGGMHDEAEIRGHRRTYLGALPGRIISAMIRKDASNPVMVLDEIDKIGKDFKGDPSMALLEVLDPEQNSHFHDNYLDADYDLSNILFIATANSLETISSPLRDRMEIISIPGYITEEKVEIARRHLVGKQLEACGFETDEISFDTEALVYIVDYYTRESGVRKLEKTIGKVLRKLAVKKVRGKEYPKLVTKELVKELLGKEEFNPDMYENNDYTGVVTGLAWTSVGGEILFIESSVTDGKGKLTLTGNLGDVMKESATIALQYLRAHAGMLGLDAEFFDKHDVHIHVPEGAIPKDGPSAGITMATSLASAFTGRKVRSKLAMTGEITLRGKVLPVGGIKEKIIAAKRAGITEIILSEENRKDILEVAERYLSGLNFTYVHNITEVLERALLPE